MQASASSSKLRSAPKSSRTPWLLVLFLFLLGVSLANLAQLSSFASTNLYSRRSAARVALPEDLTKSLGVLQSSPLFLQNLVRLLDEKPRCNGGGAGSAVRSFGNPAQVARDSCHFVAAPLPTAVNLHFEDLSVELPVYGSADPTRFFRCTALGHFVRSRANWTRAESVAKACMKPQPRALVDSLLELCVPGAPAAVTRAEFQAWLADTRAGALWTAAAQRALQLSSPCPRALFLLAHESLWLPALPSAAAQAALGDVNTHELSLPPTAADVVYARDARVEASGRVVAARGQELYYPDVAPYFHKALLLTYNGSVEKGMRFHDDAEARRRFVRDANAPPSWQDVCAGLAKILYISKIW